MEDQSNMSKSKGQKELDEYIFTRPEMAQLLGISTNALRMRMRKGRCDLDYRFDGNQFKFKRPAKERVISMMGDHIQTSHEKSLKDYDRKVQKRYNRGATHKGKGKYSNDVFQRHNEMKIMNHIQGKFKSDEHRKRFEKLNDKALKKIDQDIRKEREKSLLNSYHSRPKYGGMVGGISADIWEQPYNIDTPRPPDTSFNITGKPYSELVGKNYKEKEPVEIDPGDFSPDDREPEFSSKVQESIWRLKNKK